MLFLLIFLNIILLTISTDKEILPYFYYIPTDEGIVAHLRVYDILYNVGRVVNRTVRIVGFKSFHYPDIDNINLCDHFDIPPPIECVNDLASDIFERYDCIFTGAQHYPGHYHFDNDMITDTNLNYSSIDCMAGPLNLDIGIYPRPMKRIHGLGPRVFSDRYWNLLPFVYRVLGIKDNVDYLMVHWRRGDQLSTRCPGVGHTTRSDREDDTVNCGTVEEFLSKINQNIKLFINTNKSSANKLLTYVATNEKNDTQLKMIKSKKIKLFSDIHEGLVEKNVHLTTLEEFVIELILMCEATYVFTWGESSINRFVYNCRQANETKKLNTIINDYRGMPPKKKIS